MILEVQHETQLDYAEPVTEWLTELRMQPVSDDLQSCHSFHLIVSQPATLFGYLDGFGNRVHHFNLLTPDMQVRILAASLVETAAQPGQLADSQAALPLDLSAAPREILDFVGFRAAVSQSPLLTPLLETLKPTGYPLAGGERLGGWIIRVGEYIYQHFEYARYVTDAASPIDDVLTQGKGVCQDFAHLMIAILRSEGIPARYVSGYIHRPNKESQSHAWCEAWVPDLGWIGFDPTNGCQVNERFVRVAVGRDYSDVPPNKGIHRGRARETISVRVATRELPRLPSLSWQDQLPPLDVPLTALLRRRAVVEAEEQIEQQQQQQ